MLEESNPSVQTWGILSSGLGAYQPMQAGFSRRTATKLLVSVTATSLVPWMSRGVSSAPDISAADPHPRRRLPVLDSEISYVDTGEGDPIVFLHGNGQYSYVWRNIIPYLTAYGRCLAPDLVGMGRSGKSPTRAYRFVDHVSYLDAWFDGVGITRNVILVAYDWGSALGFYRAYRYPQQIQAVAYWEAIVKPRRWEEMSETAAATFRRLRSPEGEHLVLDENYFVEVIVPRGVIRKLSDEELAAYRAPYAGRESRLPTLVWPRELPIGGEPADVVAIVEQFGEWMSRSAFPKLFVNGDPGAIMVGAVREFCRSWPNQGEITVKGRHLLQEDSPEEIGVALADFVKQVRR
jgi:haloalkane dehalogenase